MMIEHDEMNAAKFLYACASMKVAIASFLEVCEVYGCASDELVKMLDESSQIRDDKKLAKRIKVLIDEYGIPKFLNKRDTFLFKVYQSFGHYFYPIAIPIIKKRLRMDTSRVIIDAARPHLTKHLATRFDQKIGQNVNLLGEVVLGDEEADKRYYSYLEALK